MFPSIELCTVSIEANEVPCTNPAEPVTAVGSALSMTGYVKTSFGQQTHKNAIPAAAGTNGVFCALPKGSFAATMAKALPAAGSHSGADAGSSKAIIAPVSAAYNVSIPGFLRINAVPSASQSTAVKIETAKRPIALHR